ncbi:hypothetical protein HZA57_01555, partial [Candidatus Poribacteria bacterium]|nr:hypothetical protein [Candidatus Poribacteria bacterium]
MRTPERGDCPELAFSTRLLAGLLVLVWLARLCTLGAYPLMDKTEGRYAEIAREMVANGQWIVPLLEPGQPFWAKPPLSMWAT